MPALVSRGRGRRTINEINMVPFIDVMLVLLIIFMVTAPLITPSVIDLPSVGKATRQPDAVIQIILRTEDKLDVKVRDQTTAVAAGELARTVLAAQRATPNSAVVISADKALRYEQVVKTMDQLQRAGVQRLGLSVQLVN